MRESLALSSNISALFFIPSVVLDAKSIIPVTGLTTNPANPLAAPFTKPNAPSFLAFSKGCVKTPVMPYLNP